MQRVVLVTGAASGIGAAVCRALAAPDITLLARRNPAVAERVAAEARTAGAVVEIALGSVTRLWRAIW